MQANLLANIRVLVTRPVHQAYAFCDMLAEQGAQVIRLPVIEIAALALSAEMTAVIARMDNIDFAVFISPNAVEYGLAALLAHGKIPDKLKLVTIGQASAQKMQQLLGRTADIYPTEQYNSEALLALDSLQSERIKNKKIVIFRGRTGREFLAVTLQQRGAIVSYAEVYQRKRPEPKNSELESIWGLGSNDGLGSNSGLGSNNGLGSNSSPDIITMSSNEGLLNLLAMLENSANKSYLQQLRQTPLVVVTEKMRINAQKSGFKSAIIVAAKASNEALLDSVLQWAKNKKTIKS